MPTIQVNERSKAGKALIETARLLAEGHKGVEVIIEGNFDDAVLLKKMLAARKSGIVEREKVLETLNTYFYS
jgi:hypothetical protein